MNETLIGPAITIFVFSFVGLIIALALWIGLSKPRQAPSPDCCVRQAEAVIYAYQLQLNRQQYRPVPKVDDGPEKLFS